MVRRVLLTSEKLRVSKPGFDAATATVGQLSIDTDAWTMMSVLAQGSVARSSFTTDTLTSSGGGSSYYMHLLQHYTISFGVTLAAPPICLISVQDPLLTDGTAISNGFAYGQASVAWSGDSGGVIGTASGATSAVTYVATTTDLTLTYEEVDHGFTVPPRPTTVHYTILRSH